MKLIDIEDFLDEWADLNGVSFLSRNDLKDRHLRDLIEDGIIVEDGGEYFYRPEKDTNSNIKILESRKKELEDRLNMLQIEFAQAIDSIDEEIKKLK